MNYFNEVEMRVTHTVNCTVHLNKAILRKFETFHRKKRVTFVCVGSHWIFKVQEIFSLTDFHLFNGMPTKNIQVT